MFLAGLAVYCFGAVAAFIGAKFFYSSDTFVFSFLVCIWCGVIVSLVGLIGLAVRLSASSAIAVGAVSVFAALFLPMLASRLGSPINVHGASFSLGLLAMVAGLGGIVSLVIGVIRATASF